MILRFVVLCAIALCASAGTSQSAHAPSGECLRLEHAVRSIMNASQPCQRDSDCTLLAFGTSVGPLTRTHARHAREAVSRFESLCHRLQPGGPQPPSHAACIQRTCARVANGTGAVISRSAADTLGL